jgi:hypothetical protein
MCIPSAVTADQRLTAAGFLGRYSATLSIISILWRKNMNLFETGEGDRWVCITCAAEEEAMIKEKQWQWIFDRQDQTLRCALCGHPDYDFDD